MLSASLYGYVQDGDENPPLLGTNPGNIVRDTFKIVKKFLAKAAEQRAAASMAEQSLPEATPRTASKQLTAVQASKAEKLDNRAKDLPSAGKLQTIERRRFMRALKRGAAAFEDYLAANPNGFILLIKAVAAGGKVALLVLQIARASGWIASRLVGGGAVGVRIFTRAALGFLQLLRDVANDPEHLEARPAPGVGVMMDKVQTPSWIGLPVLMNSYQYEMQRKDENPVVYDGPEPEPDIRAPLSDSMRRYRELPQIPRQRPPQRFLFDRTVDCQAQEKHAEWALDDFQRFGDVTTTVYDHVICLDITVPPFAYLCSGAEEIVDGHIYRVLQPGNSRRQQGYPLPLGSQQILEARQHEEERMERLISCPCSRCILPAS